MKGHLPRAAFSILLVIVLFALPSLGQTAPGTTEKIFEDKENDVVSDKMKRALDRLIDIEELQEESGQEFDERKYVDIVRFGIRENDTYVTYSIETLGGIERASGYTYTVSGYSRKDPKSTDPFDFILKFSGGNISYLEWQEGSYRTSSNVSLVVIDGHMLNVTMNRGRFVLSSRQTPYVISAMSYLDKGVGKTRYLDHVETTKLGSSGSASIDETTLIIIQLAFFGLAFLVIVLLWNFWVKRRGLDQAGGVCPKCEGRLDPKLDFCPSCGAFIRGPLMERHEAAKPPPLPPEQKKEE